MKSLIAWLDIVPRILSLVAVIEEQIPLPQAGKEKLDLLLSLIKVLYDASSELSKEFSWSKLLFFIPLAVKVFVDVKNKLGLFKHSETPIA